MDMITYGPNSGRNCHVSAKQLLQVQKGEKGTYVETENLLFIYMFKIISNLYLVNKLFHNYIHMFNQEKNYISLSWSRDHETGANTLLIL